MQLTSNSIWESIFILIGILLFMGYGYYSGKTDWTGSLSGGGLAILIYISSGIPGIVYFMVFFVVGSQSSKWKYQEKVSLGVAQENYGKRTWVHALSNAGAAGFISVLYLFGFNQELAHLAIACVFAAATSDTLSSELGNVLGKQYFNILTFQADKRGEDGVISPEGSAVGAIGSLLISFLYLLFTFDFTGFVTVLFIGISSNVLDSVLGATLQRRQLMNNHMVNLASTFFAFIAGVLLYLLLSLLQFLFN